MNQQTKTQSQPPNQPPAPELPPEHQRITVYRPHMRHQLGWFRTWAVMAANIYGARDLIWQLFKRDLTAGYKKSFVGISWMFIQPIMGIVTWVFLQKAGMLRPGEELGQQTRLRILERTPSVTPETGCSLGRS